MLVNSLLILLGFALLIKGADWLVSGSSALAKKYRVSDLAIGLTIVAFGTSAPELVVNAFASVNKHQEIVFGNVIGSNNFNLFMILGLAGLISPLVVQSSTVWKEIPLSLLAAIMLFVFANDYFFGASAILNRTESLVLLAMFVLFLLYVYKQLKTDPAQPQIEVKKISVSKIALFIVIGLAGLVIGGQLVVTQAVAMAAALGVSEKIIGLTIVAMGTSLPELATSVVAAFKKNNDIAVGNIIGSNIFNVFFILSVSGLINPIPYDKVFNTDLYLLILGTVLLFGFMFSGQKRKLDRWEAAILLLIYIGYTAYLVIRETNSIEAEVL
ncbi:MAG TPA: calcium/sodium antiporter [Cyclobacteriaceae bacterium]|nr:calcium/sodium antiporter [Cyclobacteriaceae bacterium]